jgi:hypothetical protein
MGVEPGQELAAIVAFLRRIGIEVRLETLGEGTFLPGLAIQHGALAIDEARLLYPGDLLHEAGHLAVMTAGERAQCDGDAGADGGAELAAIGWSYAAALAIGLDPAVVFHPHGYKSGAASLLENFAAGRYLGLPLLQWYGLTRAETYPQMDRWLRE